MKLILLLLATLLTLQAITARHSNPIQCEEIQRWTCISEPSLYASGGWLFIHGGEETYTGLKAFTPDGLERLIRLTRGEGPGEVRAIKSVILQDGMLHLWDPLSRRISRYHFDYGRFQDSQKHPEINMSSKMVALNGSQPIFAVSRPRISDKKRNLSQQIEGLAPDPLVVVPKAELKLDNVWSLNIPLMLSTASSTHLAVADSMNYHIIIHPIISANPVIIKKKTATIPWSKKLRHFFGRIDKTQREEMGKADSPKKVHPLIALSLSEQRLAVCRNDRIEMEEALIDFYSLDALLLGHISIPALFVQYVALSPMQFSLGFVMVNDHHLACLHYDHDDDLYIVALYRLAF